MRKTRKLSQVQKLKLSIMRLEGNNRSLHQNFTSLSAEHRQKTDRLAWLEEQAKRDRMLIEHLVDTAKYSAMKGVQAGVVSPRR